ncbi:phenylalanine 4-monooxygenase [Galbibacter marinus]|uniref:Phenylalanine 4-monooxygenase n=1 Tax=Galbibacter marinus TaxID=555500 RepID=K2QLY9_9FLAO|nr:aromatic amino acid hydroxylase [Galbibacter marinus]EKF55812.1 phenylalanine 4-monooxygenase [Galbibacter marinus]
MDSNYQSNPLIDRLPAHLKQYIKPQNYEHYSAINQATWRYVMRKNVDYLKKVAHHSYTDGLKKTGIDIDHIPSMYGMNRILKDIGWAAVAVDGFIPPNAFMEFQAHNVLVIASEIRQLDHIQYTPAPDIIHEGAGHAPIIANPEYAEYLRRFGEIGAKAISNEQDHQIYHAVRTLSILKEAENPDSKAIEEAEAKVNQLQETTTQLSEMARIRNLHWWTVEYGLIGNITDPKIYGAGLLSSIGESKWCMTDKVQKIPYSIEAAEQGFDITKPQPQLYVTPDFAHLSQVLEEFANTMAIRRGGLSGIKKLIASNALGTLELSTGIQISGVFSEVIEHHKSAIYFQTKGKTALAYRDKELVGHGTDRYPKGFGSTIGKLKGINLAIEDMSPRDLKAYNIYEGHNVQLEFEGDIYISGKIITGTRNLMGKIILISLENCTVKHKGRILFSPNQGIYQLAIGKEAISAYNGVADVKGFDLITHQSSPNPVAKPKSDYQKQLEALYQQVRDFREGKNKTISRHKVFEQIQNSFPDQWLLTIELYELAKTSADKQFAQEIVQHLEGIKERQPEVGHLIDDGISLVEQALVIN